MQWKLEMNAENRREWFQTNEEENTKNEYRVEFGLDLPCFFSLFFPQIDK